MAAMTAAAAAAVAEEGAAAIADALKGNPVLTELWLYDNRIGDAGAIALGNALMFNKVLTKLLSEVTEGTDGVIKSHSFRSGVATEMGKLGCTEEEIMAQGRWSSQAFKAYVKMGSLKKIELAAKLRRIVCA